MSWRAYIVEELSHSYFGWMPTFEDACESALNDNAGEIGELKVEYDGALHTARSAGWGGSFQDKPRVFSIPQRDDLRFGFIWTQPETDDTPKLAFVISPIDLPWLGEPDATQD